MGKGIMTAGDRKYEMELGPLEFNVVTDNLDYKKICFFIWRSTQFANIDWVTVITLSLKFPFIRIAIAYTTNERGEE